MLFSTIALLLTSCSGDDENNTDIDPTLPKTITYNYPDFPQENSKSTITYDGNKIVSIEKLGSKTVYTYDGNRIIKQEVFDLLDSEKITKKKDIAYTYENGKLKTRLFREGFTTEYPDGRYIYKSVYTHTSDDVVSYIYYTVNATTKVETKSSEGNVTYKDGNMVKEQEIIGSSVSTRVYEYDSKNNPLKNIIGFDLLLNETPFSINNISKINRTETEFPDPVNYIYAYIYNDNNYPVKQTSFAGDGVSIEYEIEYTY
ncbi:hypothetical protein GON26_12140 [Flavobacterium sp. GA093]|uniref:YD repeat-containing protein n=1 Tax=Flavobacterium hydrocarbonoxydans TaxID=2683249 RepID=A0A6I4NM22_9FLAO|nr:hypothetical protein [Flavobacterium hydrocarbonoxydans]MWB95113.1 hypothetical protein [Flavobacterium hydrocarbonoxydans]